jgi:hypothetical protein
LPNNGGQPFRQNHLFNGPASSHPSDPTLQESSTVAEFLDFDALHQHGLELACGNEENFGKNVRDVGGEGLGNRQYGLGDYLDRRNVAGDGLRNYPEVRNNLRHNRIKEVENLGSGQTYDLNAHYQPGSKDNFGSGKTYDLNGHHRPQYEHTYNLNKPRSGHLHLYRDGIPNDWRPLTNYAQAVPRYISLFIKFP